VLGVIVVIVAVAFASALFYQRALQDKVVDQVAPDAISRTIREIQNPNPGLRLQIWARTWHHVSTEPDLLLFGRGIGMYPVDEGFGAPDWLGRNAEGSKHYPHNVHLEVLYESGIIGLLLFSIITLFPLLTSLRRWQLFSSVEKAAISLYMFILVSSEISGAFAFSYDLQFFLGLAVGITALRRMKDVVVTDLRPADDNLDRGYPECIRF
jgi:O-antigen ligase